MKTRCKKAAVYGYDAAQRIYKLLRMNLRNRYMGSKMGMFWAVLQPLTMMLTYIFVFGFIFESKVAGSDNSLDYVTWFLCGFTPWMAINEGIMATASSVISGVSLVKNFSIRAEFLSIASALMGIPQMLVGLVVIFLISFATGLGSSWHIVWLLPVVFILFLFITGVGFFLSATTVFKRDMIQIIPTFMQFIFYFTPIFYGAEQLGIFGKATFINPIYQICTAFREILFYHSNPDIKGLLYVLVLSSVLWIAGYRYFCKLKGFFESAL